MTALAKLAEGTDGPPVRPAPQLELIPGRPIVAEHQPVGTVREEHPPVPGGDSVQPGGDPHERYHSEVRSGQLDELAELADHLAVTHIVVVATVAYIFWGINSRTYLIPLLGVIFSAMIALAVGARSYRLRPANPALVETWHKAASGLVLTLAVAWGTMPLSLYSHVDDDGRTIVVAICAGLISSTFVFGSVPYLSWLFGIPVAAGSFFALFLRRDGTSVNLSVLLVVYAAFVLFSARRMTRLAVQRIVDRLRVGEQNETISLLLHEFEENASDWLWETDERGYLQHVSERMAHVSDRPIAALREAPFASLFGPTPVSGEVSAVIALVEDRVPFRNHLVEVRIAGVARWWRLSGKPIQDRAGRFAGFRGVGSDITETRRSEARIAYLASYDSLTGLANRTLFHDRATLECERAVSYNRSCALLYLDLDRFKLVNDTLGHGFGDRLLNQVAHRLSETAKGSALVARLGGDEFAILHPCESEAEAVSLAEAVIAAVSVPYLIDGVHAELGGSVGIALTPRDARSPQSLLGKADLALYRGKTTGRGRACLFEAELEATVRARRELEADLKTALENGEFLLHYQPLVAVEDGRVHSFEALLRWTKPGRGQMSPADFVPVAEASGLISAVGRWVLQEACIEAATWPRDIRVAVNLSPTQFRNSDLVHDVVSALSTSGLAADRLELEITESVFLELTAATVSNLRDLRALGVRIALDDFGTGYSSLSYLIKFPVDKIKIDRSFIKDMDTRHECLAIIEAILTLARKLAITVTAEGVETIQQFRMLQRSHCDDIQGFLFSPGMPAHDVPSLITTLPKRFAEIVCQPSLTGPGIGTETMRGRGAPAGAQDAALDQGAEANRPAR